ncbi:MAG: LemA family protein [Bacteroidales bacterium]|jgi:LemA protein|nr:LemA family protein [Bacteroidales bacterium]
MTRKTISIILVVGVILLLVLLSVSGYNELVMKDETCKKQWSAVESRYKQRADLALKYVNKVKDYASHEQETLTRATRAVNQALQVKISPNNITQTSINELQIVQNNLSLALQQLNTVSERHSELKTNNDLLVLQSQLKDMENQIAVERQCYADVTGDFNVSISRFPANVIANLFGFERKTVFDVEKGIENISK